MNARDKVKSHRSAWGFGAPTAHEVIIRGLPASWKVYRGEDDLTVSGRASRDGDDWKYAAVDDSELPLYVIDAITQEARALVALPPVEANFSELLPDLAHSAPGKISVLNIPLGWKLLNGNTLVDSELGENTGYRTGTWRSFKAPRGAPLRIKSSDGTSYSIPDSSVAVVTIPDVATLTGAAPTGDTTTPGDSSASGTLTFTSVGGWARNRALIVTSANDNNNAREFPIDASGNATARIPAGQWIISVHEDSRTTPIVMVAGQTVPVTLTDPTVTPAQTGATLVIFGVLEGERLESLPALQFRYDSTRAAYIGSIPQPTDGQRMHVTLVRRDGQNDSRTVALSSGATIEIRFNPAPAVADDTNYILWGAAGFGALSLAYALTAGKSGA